MIVIQMMINRKINHKPHLLGAILPGHFTFVSQASFSLRLFSVTQCLPPFCGAGFVHVRI